MCFYSGFFEKSWFSPEFQKRQRKIAITPNSYCQAFIVVRSTVDDKYPDIDYPVGLMHRSIQRN